MPTHELMQGERDFVGMRCAPGNNALELDGIVRNGADFHQLGFDDLRVSHRNSSMAHLGTWKAARWAARWMFRPDLYSWLTPVLTVFFAYGNPEVRQNRLST